MEKVKNQGIDLQLFEAAKKAAFGDRIMRFDNVKSIASMFVESFITGDDIWAVTDTLSNITAEDVTACAELFCRDNAALSVIKNS